MKYQYIDKQIDQLNARSACLYHSQQTKNENEIGCETKFSALFWIRANSRIIVFRTKELKQSMSISQDYIIITILYAQIHAFVSRPRNWMDLPIIFFVCNHFFLFPSRVIFYNVINSNSNGHSQWLCNQINFNLFLQRLLVIVVLFPFSFFSLKQNKKAHRYKKVCTVHVAHYLLH